MSLSAYEYSYHLSLMYGQWHTSNNIRKLLSSARIFWDIRGSPTNLSRRRRLNERGHNLLLRTHGLDPLL